MLVVLEGLERRLAACRGFEIADASYVGVEARASTSPLRGSSITTAPAELAERVDGGPLQARSESDRSSFLGSYGSAPNLRRASATGSPARPDSSAS